MGSGVVDDKVTSHAESDEKILTFDISDEALERAGSAKLVRLQLATVKQFGVTSADHGGGKRRTVNAAPDARPATASL